MAEIYWYAGQDFRTHYGRIAYEYDTNGNATTIGYAPTSDAEDYDTGWVIVRQTFDASNRVVDSYVFQHDGLSWGNRSKVFVKRSAVAVGTISVKAINATVTPKKVKLATAFGKIIVKHLGLPTQSRHNKYASAFGLVSIPKNRGIAKGYMFPAKQKPAHFALRPVVKIVGTCIVSSRKFRSAKTSFTIVGQANATKS